MRRKCGVEIWKRRAEIALAGAAAREGWGETKRASPISMVGTLARLERNWGDKTEE